MSAIAGLWQFKGGPDAAQDCARMLDAQSIYGSYRVGAWSEGPVALGRRLARLLPEDVYDEQPLGGGGGRYVLVADLRLDNWDELIAALDIPADTARSMCDAALLLAAFERWDEYCCERLVGDYAFAVWDMTGRRLVLARDFLGQRPLHYHRGADFVAFASMPKGLHALAEIPRAPDEERIAEFLVLMPDYGTRSFFANVERVKPGTVVTITRDGMRARRHWQWDGRKLAFARSEDYVEGLRHYLDRAVRDRLRGVSSAVAAHLSCGFDSSAVATTAARLLAPSGGKVVAFTAAPREGYDLPSPERCIGDESILAAHIASKHSNIEHVVIRSGHRSPLDQLDRNFFLLEQPVLSLTNNVWGSAISDEARRRNLGILLTGQMGNMSLSYGGDEIFPELIASFQWAKWMQLAMAERRYGGSRWRRILVKTFAPWFPPGLWRFLERTFLGHSRDITQYTALSPARFLALDLTSRARPHGLDFSYRPWKNGLARRLWALGCGDSGNYIKATLGGWGLDARDPTADRRLVEFCLAVPTDQYYQNGVGRSLARRALADRLPAEVLREKRKGRQAIDWHDGLNAARPQLFEEISRLEQIAPAVRALDVARMRTLVEHWPSDGWHRPEIVECYELALLRGISVGHFIRRASGANV
jgi:asparagine synthase (glutamine-hydrolysing)